MSESTRDRIVRCADRLQRQRGFAGWSFGDISEEIGIRRASIHHHFPTKGALLAEVVAYDLAQARTIAATIADLSPRAQLDAFFASYAELLATETLCVCGALTIDLPGLPEDASAPAAAYVAALHGWLSSVLTLGQELGEIRRTALPTAQADLVIASLQGALQRARAQREPAVLNSVIGQLRALLSEDP